MKRVVTICILVLGVLVAVVPASPVMASGSIERACVKADRPNATPSMCRCIQGLANAMFTSTERSKIAKFFKDPHVSQVTRQSDRNSDERFWLKYKDFGEVVKRQCRR